ncbi:MAG: mechanosensitive ion channel family protein [Desulfobacteraceae bacterium]
MYRVVMEAFRVILSPDDSRLRPAAMADETANYYWLWLRRFANYAALYAVAMGVLVIRQTPASALAFIRGLLLLGFPAMITVLILQVAREIRMRLDRPSGSEGNEEDKKRRKWDKIGVRYLPALAVAYTWTVFFFLVADYSKGFRYLLEATLGTALTVLLVSVALRLMGLLFNRLFTVQERIKERFPGFEQKANRYITTIQRVSAGIVMVIGGGIIAQIWGIPMGSVLASDTGASIVLRATTIGVTLGVVFLVIQVNLALCQHILRPNEYRIPSQKTQTLVPMIRTAVNLGAGFVGGIVILGSLGVDTTPILAGAGIVGLAVGFGAQTLVKDLINGLFILFEESIRVGDWADLGGKGGLVERVGLRTVRLRDLHGSVHVIPNSSIDILTNYSKEFSRAVMDIGIAYREDVDDVIEILKQIGQELREDPDFGGDILEPLEIFGLERFDDSAVVIRIRFTTKPLKQWGVRREFYRRMKRVFDEKGVEIPFPHMTVYMGLPKTEPAPPLNIRVTRNDEDKPVSLPLEQGGGQ